jgi:predicted  nucleic acid-binding Zn-ribbon protein
MNEQSDTPRTDETEKIADKMDSPAAAYGFTLARLKEIEKELTAARAEIDMMGIRYAAAEMHHSNNMQEVTEQRDRLKEALKDVMKSGDSTIMYRTAETALQSLTTNEKSPSTGATE